MKKFTYGKRGFAAFLAACFAIGSLSGCGKKPVSEEPEGTQSVESSVTESVEKVPADISSLLSDGDGNLSLIASIKNTFASANLEEDYNKGMYNLPKDYVFEFPCSFDAGMLSFKAFKVYATPDYTESFRTYNQNTYEDGILKIAPGGVVQLDADRSRDIDNGTWGSLNQLYLVQFIDLETGEDLEKPIVTPFTVQHDVKAPVVSQGVDEKNNYTLSWKPVEGAVQYVVYEFSGGCSYTVCCTTKATSVSSKDFEKQMDMENLLDLFKNDLEKAGYTVDKNGVSVMNSGVTYKEDLQNGYFTVIAIDGEGKTSGISNIVDVRDVAQKLPHSIEQAVMTREISEINDVPAFVNVEMIDGSIAEMIIDYHGAEAYKYPDDPNKIAVRAHVANTDFENFLIVMTGMEYSQVVSEIKVVLDREDSLLSKVRPADPEMAALEITDEEPDVKTEFAKPTEQEPVAEPSVPETEEAIDTSASESTVPETESQTYESFEQESMVTEPVETPAAVNPPEALMAEVNGMVTENINLLGANKIKSVLYAKTDLEAWMAYCLIAQSDVIPMPISVFPEAANVQYAYDLLLEAYRQNPTSGVVNIGEVRYNDKYEAFIIKYVEDTTVRLDKTKKELDKAQEVVKAVIQDSMSDYDKVLALNNYFCENASYDFDSMSTNVDINNLSESFIDAHTPYGILCSNYGVCESYSEAFVLTARMAGLEAVAEFGSLHGGGHEWNRVKVDGKWRVLDVTNNDNDTFSNGLFNISDEQMNGILVPSKQGIVDRAPFAANSNDKEFYFVNGKCATDMDDAKALVKKILSTEDKACIRLPLGTTEEQVGVLVKGMMKEGVAMQKAYFNLGLLYIEK